MNDIDEKSVSAHTGWPWVAAAILLWASAAMAAVSVHLFWIPCQGTMLNGTAFAPAQTMGFTDACLTRMDTGFPFWSASGDPELGPWASLFGSLAMLLAAASWIVLVLGLRLRKESTWTAMAVAVAPTTLAVLNLASALYPGRGLEACMPGWLWFAVDVVAVVVFVALVARSGLKSGILVGLAVVLWGATSFGLARALIEFYLMMAFNQNNWDVPPGTGWITVAALVVAGSASFWFAGRRWESATLAQSGSRPT